MILMFLPCVGWLQKSSSSEHDAGPDESRMPVSAESSHTVVHVAQVSGHCVRIDSPCFACVQYFFSSVHGASLPPSLMPVCAVSLQALLHEPQLAGQRFWMFCECWLFSQYLVRLCLQSPKPAHPSVDDQLVRCFMEIALRDVTNISLWDEIRQWPTKCGHAVTARSPCIRQDRCDGASTMHMLPRSRHETILTCRVGMRTGGRGRQEGDGEGGGGASQASTSTQTWGEAAAAAARQAGSQ